MLRKPSGLLYQAVQKTPHDFIAHVGDIKSGAVPCTNAILKENYTLISKMSHQPFIYTPGDNDWTDCDRKNLTPRYDELERLKFIRSEFSHSAVKLNHYQRQTAQPENQTWLHNNIRFITLHVVGTNNGRKQILLSDKKLAREKINIRDKHNLKWLLSHLNKDLAAAVIFMQADIFVDPKHDKACTQTRQKKCDGFKQYKQVLHNLAKEYDFPILLSHGDTKAFCLSKRASGLWQLNGPGDFQYLDIAKVTINPNNQTTPFTVRSLLSDKTISACK
ncbi:hypothetical protein PCIT_a3184 [Pseudoalteromonas citrea]|uniref:Calcineurin-like phosphoesterase domain-containing protein n=2 Tax=Pseudoalteromonas citrea TaxID=43655 RepID=A0AAD4FRS0_9GAMM|nr:hypothetical protein PCIT_a3184 [Pseudoalteromonas citrea]